MDDYTFFYSGSQNSREMRDFLDENSINYTLVHKDRNSISRIFIKDEPTSYKEKDFGSLKSRMLEDISEKVLAEGKE